MSPNTRIPGSNLTHLSLAPYRFGGLTSLMTYDFTAVFDTFTPIHIGRPNSPNLGRHFSDHLFIAAHYLKLGRAITVNEMPVIGTTSTGLVKPTLIKRLLPDFSARYPTPVISMPFFVTL